MKIITNKKTWISILSCILFSVTLLAQKSYPPAENLNFTTKYIKANKNKFIVETPEVHELGNIAIALTKVGQIDSNMINMNTDYYKKVITYLKRSRIIR